MEEKTVQNEGEINNLSETELNDVVAGMCATTGIEEE